MAFRKSLVFFSILFLSCAYFNTFYNAKVYFREAEKLYREQGQNTRETSAKYNKVIEKCSKIFEFYKNSSYVDDALYLTAISYKRLGDLTKSKVKFEELYTYFPNSPYAKKAFYEYLDLLVSLGYIDEAMAFLKSHPELEKKPEFILVKVKIFAVNKDYSGLLDFVERNWALVNKTQSKREILKMALNASMKERKFDLAEKYLKELELVSTNESDKFTVLITRIQILSSKKNYREALEILNSASFQEGSSFYRLLDYERARLWWLSGEPQKALDVVGKILEKGGRDSVYVKTLLLKAQIMESLDSLSTALSIYQDLRNFPLNPNLRDEVNARYNTLLDVVGSEDSASVYVLLRKAELYLMDLKNPQKALEYYQEVVERSEDEESSAKALYMCAVIYRFYLNEKEKAEEMEKLLLSKFPNSFQAYKLLDEKKLNSTDN